MPSLAVAVVVTITITVAVAIAVAVIDAFWNTLDGSSMYDEKLVSRIAKEKIAYNVTWKDDPIKTARSEWKFWRVHRKNVKKFHIAKQLI